MRISFISANREIMPYPVIPLGISYIMGATPEHHHKQLWDLCFHEDYKSYLKEKISQFNPELFAISIRNIQNNNYSGIKENLQFYITVIDTIRSFSNSPILIGGSGFSVLPQKIMHKLKPDFGISGEGEHSFRQFLDVLEKRGPTGLDKKTLNSIPNFYYFKNKHLCEVPPAASFIDLKKNFPTDKSKIEATYYSMTGIDSIQSKRGCIFSCTYCTYPDIEGDRSRLRQAKDVVDEMFQSKRQMSAVEHFFIVDSVFNYPKKHAMEICQEMIDRQLKTPWTCYINPNGYDLELASKMAESGCRGIEIGSDSGSDEVLKRLKKGFNVKKVKNLNKICQEVGIKDCHNFILGTPGETKRHIDETIQFIEELDAQSIIIMIWVDDNEFFDTPADADREKLRQYVIQQIEERSVHHSNWIVPALGIRFDKKLLNFVTKRFGKGPAWQYL